MKEIFLAGGVTVMTLLTAALVVEIAMIWFAPRLCRVVGKIAVVVAVINGLLGFSNAAKAVIAVGGDISPTLIWGGIRCFIVSLVYSLIIYLISLIIGAFIEIKNS